MERVHLTRDGYEKLARELEYLKNIKRKELSQAIGHARSLGDLRENAEYAAAKEALAFNEKRISELEDILSRVEIINESKIGKDKIYLGAKVTLLDLDTDEESRYVLVAAAEADPMVGLISVNSPVGKALLGRKVDEVIRINVPAGVINYKIVEIER